MRKTILGFIFFLLPAAIFGQTTPTQLQNLYAVGGSWNSGASPQVAGNALQAHLVNSDGTYEFTDLDILPNTVHPFTVTTNIGTGVAQKILTVGNVPLYIPTSAGISLTGANTGWQWNGGVLASIHFRKQFYILPNIRFLKSSVSNGSGYQLIAGVDFGLGQ